MRIRLLALGMVMLVGCSSGSSGPARPPNPELRHTTGAEDTAPQSVLDDARAAEATRWAEQLGTDDSGQREQAAAALAELREDGFPHLLEGMRHSSWQVRLTSLQAVHKPVLEQHAEEAIPLLTQLLQDASPLVRQQAAYRLSWFGDRTRSVLPQLERLAAQDPNPDVRATAADVVVELNESLANLQQLLQHRNPLVRARAAGTLAGLEHHARNALPSLEHLAGNDPDPEVRQAAAQALQNIRQALANRQ